MCVRAHAPFAVVDDELCRVHQDVELVGERRGRAGPRAAADAELLGPPLHLLQHSSQLTVCGLVFAPLALGNPANAARSLERDCSQTVRARLPPRVSPRPGFHKSVPSGGGGILGAEQALCSTALRNAVAATLTAEGKVYNGGHFWRETI